MFSVAGQSCHVSTCITRPCINPHAMLLQLQLLRFTPLGSPSGSDCRGREDTNRNRGGRRQPREGAMRFQLHVPHILRCGPGEGEKTNPRCGYCSVGLSVYPAH